MKYMFTDIHRDQDADRSPALRQRATIKKKLSDEKVLRIVEFFFIWSEIFNLICILFKVQRWGKRWPSGHPSTGKAGSTRCLVRWKSASARSFITFRRSVDRGLGRNSAVAVAVFEPFLSHSSTQMNKNWVLRARND